ncbi:MAG: hypothetical protein ISS82_05820 [Nanoarchaeota archaeon]|nr:hypothetical protein [Nanoarchaeota archaeon]
MEKDIISLKKEEMEILINALGYHLDEEGIVLDTKKEKVICPFTKKEINICNISVMPGSLVLMNTNPVTLSEYFYQYPDD